MYQHHAQGCAATRSCNRDQVFHIADCLGASLQAKGVRKLGLLGTRFTMIEDFYSKRLAEKFGIETLIPDRDDITTIDGSFLKNSVSDR